MADEMERSGCCYKLNCVQRTWISGNLQRDSKRRSGRRGTKYCVQVNYTAPKYISRDFARGLIACVRFTVLSVVGLRIPTA